MHLNTLLSVLGLLASAIAGNLEGRVVWNEICPGYSDLGHSKVILDDGRYAGGIRRDGSFQIPDVDEGSYILSVVSHDYAFDSLRVDVHTEGDALPDIRPFIPGTPHNPPSPVTLRYPIVLTPRQKAEYFVERQAFNLLGMLKNPMILMMVAMGGLVLGMPYIIKNLDPELVKEVNERQSRYSGIQSALQSGNIREGVSLLASNEQDAPSPPPAGSKQPSGSGKVKSYKSGKRR